MKLENIKIDKIRILDKNDDLLGEIEIDVDKKIYFIPKGDLINKDELLEIAKYMEKIENGD